MAEQKVLNCDCIEFMKTLKDGAYDLAIVAPPYGVGSITYMPRTRHKAIGGFIDEYNITVATLDMNNRKKMTTNIIHSQTGNYNLKFGDENVAPPPEYFAELFRVSKNQIIWGGNYFLLPPSRGFIVWDKCQSEKFSMAMAEYAWTSIQGNAKIFRGQANGTPQNPRIHPTQKPIKLYNWLLKNYAKEGDKILDTHVGSGSSRIACYILDFEFMGCEIDKAYFDAQEKRYNDYVEKDKETGGLDF